MFILFIESNFIVPIIFGPVPLLHYSISIPYRRFVFYIVPPSHFCPFQSAGSVSANLTSVTDFYSAITRISILNHKEMYFFA